MTRSLSFIKEEVDTIDQRNLIISAQCNRKLTDIISRVQCKYGITHVVNKNNKKIRQDKTFLHKGLTF